MTLSATRVGILAKLTAMNILVAIDTPKSQWPIPDKTVGHELRFLIHRRSLRCSNQSGLGVFFRMTFSASDLQMRTGQSKARRVVIKLGLTPGIVDVTNLATTVRHARAKLSGVHVLMARLATIIGKYKEHFAGETARRWACVTEPTRGGQVCAGQLERGFLMLGQSELRRPKSLDRVAAFTPSFISAPGKLTGVLIGMTIATELMRQFPFEIAAGVTLLAFDLTMLSAQRKVCQIVIECSGRNLFPTVSRMTFGAIASEAATMRILMARNAICKLQAGILHESPDLPWSSF